MGIHQLFEIAQARERTILGLMSGTSLDGLDLALCSFFDSGSRIRFEILHHGTVSYTSQQRTILRELATARTVDMESLCIYHTEVAHWHAGMVRTMLGTWGVAASEVDLIASHGQTIRHAPRRIHKRAGLPDSTFQIGEPDHLAHLTGIITISDFRQKHVAAGGEGAPLAVYGDRLLFYKQGEVRVLLNIGGIANITILDGTRPSEKLPITFDTGPGNTLMDRTVQQYFPDKLYDVNGAIAATGTVHERLLDELLAHPYFNEPPPKTTGPELLSLEMLELAMTRAAVTRLSPEDLLATLTLFTARTISQSIERHTNSTDHLKVYVSGGGVHNRTLMHQLQIGLPQAEVLNFESLGVHPDAKEAVFFAALANEFVCGNAFPVPSANRTYSAVTLGKVSFPD